MTRRFVSLLCLALAGLVACGPDVPQSWSDLRPLEANKAPLPLPEENEPFPERLMVVSGEGNGFYYAHGRGYVHAPISKVWEAMADPEVLVDRRRVASWKAQKGIDSNFPVSLRIHYVVRDLITLEWDSEWRQAPVEGGLEHPEVIVGRGGKTEGSMWVPLLQDSFVLRRVAPNGTQFEFIRHVDGMTLTPDVPLLYLQDLFGSVVKWVHDEPLPTYQ